jgi:transposase InsO family protein
MRIGEEVRRRVIELDRRHRSAWDARAIAHVIGISASTVAKILREFRGPRPKRAKQPHTRRTRFIKRDVMWSSDFVRLGWGWLLLRTIDEMSGYRLGWELCRGETAAVVLAHARSIAERMGRVPLTWKYDHGSAFTSKAFQRFLEEHNIVPYPTQPYAPWTNGRVERDHQDVHTWLIPLTLASAGKEPAREVLDREIDEGMLMFNYVKPRAVHGFRKSAEVYFGKEAELDVDKKMRTRLAECICDVAFALGSEGCGRKKRRSQEQMHRRTVRLALQKLGLYYEWDVAAPKGPPAAGVVNRTGASDVAF